MAAAAAVALRAPGAGRMRAWRVHAYGALAELRLDEARVPPLRRPRDVLVRVRAASLNPIDVAMIGGYGARALNTLRALDGADGVEFPLVPGRDFVGTVERAGPAARLRPGQRVWGVVPPHCQGSHADFVVVKDEWAGVAPRALEDAAAGGALYAALTACAALRAAALGPRPRVLLLGLGGVGQAALQLLVARGAHVTVGCSGELAGLAERLGAAVVLDRHAPEYDHQLEACSPYSAVLDCAGLGGEEAAARRWRFARYVTLSTPLLRQMDARGLAAGALCAGAALLAQSARVAGAGAAGALPPHVRWAFFSPSAADIELLRRLAERGQFAVCVERVWAWWRAAEAFERAARGGARGKLLLDWTAPPPQPA
ncbi:reticulon-4-interacting protein 1, mitochondrial [Helicoverpa armigera]|uniref:reticulon-4-interacting protein 1, mitochondrial n=2 Tax=Helicoverpa TaxID=7112 RepID=UPI001F5A25A8|nr:reticulon-4-interacting protein 1, mitochondrial isoform X2 [Helicoverpa zea]XP_047026839.1 reticulon-4-interacting protein 1, mitochondrial isoform X2 [Helicoverpa zea]XP_049706567.1 reticulon-4-interacting protein 1, mitochondrial [Helicoverpa armigera]XP_049706568.1 reticulon-4-interacting protein 1, mitochondrial [Helicoverpa armigera]